LFWDGDPRVKRRTQSSIALSVDGDQWVLLNCSPDIREQISAVQQLQPKNKPRHSPIVGVVITNGDIDHIGGLLSLRESHSFTIWASANVLKQIADNPVFAVLNQQHVNVREIDIGAKFNPVAGLEVEAFVVPGKVPLYKESPNAHAVDRSGTTLGLHLRHRQGTMSYVPGCGQIDDQLLGDLAQTDTLFFDGTLWTDGEMIASNTGQKTGRRMGHVPVSGSDGSMALLEKLPAVKKIFVHLNNTNPLLIDGSPEQQQAAKQGWLVAHDGMEVEI
jgi:pyrroloquinoline quinone biosynthesis protein B